MSLRQKNFHIFRSVMWPRRSSEIDTQTAKTVERKKEKGKKGTIVEVITSVYPQ